jgi:hypothetical protein
MFLVVAAASQADQFVWVTKPGWTNSTQLSFLGSWGDYDNDGFIDLFVANMTQTTTGWTNFVYHNNRDGTFSRRLAAQVGTIASDSDASAAGYWADINNDGLLDVFVINNGESGSSASVPNRLYLNQGSGRFQSSDAGDVSQAYHQPGFGGLADYDNDGNLDAFVCAAWLNSGQLRNLLFHGNGDGTFRRVTNSLIATDSISASFSNDALWADLDNDGKVDLVIGNYLLPQGNFVYHNEGGGRFTRVTNSLLETYATGFLAAGDYDNDGSLDVAGVDATGVHLFRNKGGGDFVLVTNWLSSTAAAAVCWADYDNDGHLDLLATIDSQFHLFHNNGDGTFNQVQDAFTGPIAQLWQNGSWGDYDNDGFMDLFVADGSGRNLLYHNRGTTNHWLKFKLQGTASNRSAIGAKVRLQATIGGKSFWQMREVSAGNSTQSDLRPNFGLGDATNAALVRIEWPSGAVQQLTNVVWGQLLTVWEPPAVRGAVQSDGSFQLTVTAQPNRTWQISWSSDLVHWQTLSRISSVSGSFQYVDTTPAAAIRFYRVVGL